MCLLCFASVLNCGWWYHARNLWSARSCLRATNLACVLRRPSLRLFPGQDPKWICKNCCADPCPILTFVVLSLIIYVQPTKTSLFWRPLFADRGRQETALLGAGRRRPYFAKYLIVNVFVSAATTTCSLATERQLIESGSCCIHWRPRLLLMQGRA